MGRLKPILVVSASELDEKTRKKIEATFLDKHKNEEVSFCYTVNPAVLGGIMINDNENYYDATLKTQLDKVKKLL